MVKSRFGIAAGQYAMLNWVGKYVGEDSEQSRNWVFQGETVVPVTQTKNTSLCRLSPYSLDLQR